MDALATASRIDVISDAICPWCYIGKRQLEIALPLLAKDGRAFDVRWHPFQLNPDMPEEGIDRREYRTAKFGSWERSQQMDARITETAASLGLEFHMNRLTRTPNTVAAHRLIGIAGELGVQDVLVEALFEAYFCNGADIGDHQTLAEIGAKAGIDREAILALLAGDEGKQQILAADQMARNAGVNGVPSFALQGHILFSGAVPGAEMASTFTRALEVLKSRAA
jgi:predicted DsbA family dithiol-disulfide isomerase